MLTDLRARGGNDILIACTDNLTGFTKAIAEVFPQTITQLCVVHQIRNSCKYVVWKERKEFTTDLKLIYAAVNKDAAKAALDDFTVKWKSKYGLLPNFSIKRKLEQMHCGHLAEVVDHHQIRKFGIVPDIQVLIGQNLQKHIPILTKNMV